MSDEQQPQLTPGDELELELRGRLVRLEREHRALAAVCGLTAVLIALLLIRTHLPAGTGT